MAISNHSFPPNYAKGQAEQSYAGPLGAPPSRPPEAPGEIPSLISQLREHLDRIGHATSELTAILAPVLSTSVPETASGPTGYAASSSLGKQLEELDNHARDLGNLLYNLRDRVQL